MSRIPDEIIQQVRDHSDVVELVGRTVTLRRAGRSYKGLCPFHDEKTPSFNVNPDRQSYYCFGCQEGGDIFSFLMKVEGLSFGEAVRTLARECGIEVPSEAGESRGDGLYEANALLAERYAAELKRGANPGAAYLERRGLDAATIERFGIGYAPEGWDFAVRALRAKKIPAEIGERAGLLAQRASGGHYDRLRGRVVFPIQDRRGRVIGFGGRALAADQEPKYLNTPESPIFRKREALYGLPLALEPVRRADRVVVVEGYFDCIALHRAGIEEAVATCGTALTEDHARNLYRRTRNVVMLFDGDEAGQRAMVRALEVLLPAGLRARAALLPPGEDPDSFLAGQGADALRALVDGAPSAVDVVIDRAASQDTSTPWGKADAVAAVAPLLARIPSAVERHEYCNRLALAVGTEARHAA
ncbi:MAG TPA: DNA primase, partial [Myxococcota bacterium]